MKGMRPFLVHCVNGKDRAGVTIAVIMLTLGCTEADVIKEYGLTNKAKHLIVGEKEGDAVSVADFRKALKDVKRTWGSFDQYIQKGIGMSKKEVYQLRRLYCG
jgi:protein-tyrosine phosphatase